MVSYVFTDEFNGPAGSPPDPSKWNHETGRWTDNNELETYTDSTANAYLDGQGHLVIKALKGTGRHGGYTSARLTTQGLFARNHGTSRRGSSSISRPEPGLPGGCSARTTPRPAGRSAARST